MNAVRPVAARGALTQIPRAYFAAGGASCIRHSRCVHAAKAATAVSQRPFHVTTPHRDADQRIILTTHTTTTVHRVPSASGDGYSASDAAHQQAPPLPPELSLSGSVIPNLDSHEGSSPAKQRAKATFAKFDLSGQTHVVTGGVQGLGLAMAEGLAEAGANVYCLDYQASPSRDFLEAQADLQTDNGGQLHFQQVDVRNHAQLQDVVMNLAAKRERLDGVIAAAGVQQLCPALEYTYEDAKRMLDINCTGVFFTAQAAAKAMFRYKSRGKICLIASMSGFIANKGLISPMYNCSKAAVIQMARSLSMEWARVNDDGTGGIRVNALCPGNIMTPMVKKNFKEVPGLKKTWESENMLGRLAEPDEFKGAALFLLSEHSSFMTGSSLVIDAGYTAW